MAKRASWSGILEFGLITIPIKLYRKTNTSSGVSFTQLNADTGNPISLKKVDSVTGRAVTELTKGYKIDNNTIVEMSLEEVNELLPERSSKLEMIAFVDAGNIDIERLDTAYVVEVGENFEHSYSLMTQAMTKTGKAALCKVVMSSKETLVLLRPKDSKLVANTLHWDDELRSVDSTRAHEVAGEELDLATQLVEKYSKKVDFSELKESFKENVRQLAQEKLANGEIARPEKKKANNKTGGKELDLLQALQASVGE